MKYDLKILQEYIDKKLIHMQVHPTLPLRIYKYSQECVFSRAWDDITMNMRGTVLDNEGNQISNSFSKFFNLEELEPLGISLPNLPYKVYDKVDGSLIEVFRYNGEIVVSSAGSFTSPQEIAAENMLQTKYAHLLQHIEEGKTYIFELIF
jgi:RNA ligase